jgi:hypothetical protein
VRPGRHQRADQRQRREPPGEPTEVEPARLLEWNL